MSKYRLLSFFMMFVFALAVIAAPAFAATSTFSNSEIITFPDLKPARIDSPYPSTIAVSGMTGVVADVNVTLNNNSNTSSDDIDILLAEPAGIAGGWLLQIMPVVAPTITSALPPSGVVGVPYSHTFTFSGNPAPAASLMGILPNGLTFDPATATISGTPTAIALSIDLVFTAANGVNPDATQTFNLVINPPPEPAILSGAPPAGIVGVLYTHTFAVMGNPFPTRSLSGTLPDGLSYNAATATISGTPTTAGTSTGLTFTAANGINPDATQTFDLVINPALTAPTITSALPPSGVVGVPYSHTFTFSGNPAPAASLMGILPNGLTFDPATATISGTPTTAVLSIDLVFTAANGINPDATQTFNLVITPAPAILSGTPPAGIVGVFYTHTFAVTGNPFPTRSLSGTLPDGLSYDAATATISGTPTTAGTSAGLTFTAANGINPDATQTFDLVIDPAPTAPTITSAPPPLGVVGVPYSHTFTASGNPTSTISLTGTLPAGLTFDVGTATISGTPTTVGTSAGLIATASNGILPNADQNFDLNVTAVPVAPLEAIAAPPAPSPGPCADLNIVGNDLLRSNFENEVDRSAVNCRMLAANGEFMTWLGGQITQEENIGDPTTLGMGVIGAVDVFNGSSSFVAGVNICLRGSGRMIFLDAADAPRIAREWNAWTTDAFPGFTCTTIWSPGTVVLVSEAETGNAGGEE